MWYCHHVSASVFRLASRLSYNPIVAELTSPRPTVGYPDEAAVFVFGREVIIKKSLMQTGQNLNVNGINTFTAQIGTKCIKCFSSENKVI